MLTMRVVAVLAAGVSVCAYGIYRAQQHGSASKPPPPVGRLLTPASDLQTIKAPPRPPAGQADGQSAQTIGAAAPSAQATAPEARTAAPQTAVPSSPRGSGREAARPDPQAPLEDEQVDSAG